MKQETQYVGPQVELKYDIWHTQSSLKIHPLQWRFMQKLRGSRVNSTTVNLAVDFIYGDDNDNISRLAREAKKRSLNRDLRWKGLATVRSLVLKNDIATMYRKYLVKQKASIPRKPLIGKSMF